MNKNSLLRAVRISALAGVVTTASLFAATSANAAIPNKTQVYCSEGSPAGFDPAQYTTGTDFTANTFTEYPSAQPVLNSRIHNAKVLPS